MLLISTVSVVTGNTFPAYTLFMYTIVVILIMLYHLNNNALPTSLAHEIVQEYAQLLTDKLSTNT